MSSFAVTTVLTILFRKEKVGKCLKWRRPYEYSLVVATTVLGSPQAIARSSNPLTTPLMVRRSTFMVVGLAPVVME